MIGPKISIILPTYNVARFLNQCLESIDHQTYTNYEVVIVVDGATDGSFDIAEKFCRTHEKFSVYWQENAGSGPARNKGLEYATGDLIMFIDPDDWIEADFVERHVLEQQKGNYDFTVSQRQEAYCKKNGDVIKVKPIRINEYELCTKDDCRKNYLKFIEEGLVNAPTRKVYKRSIIADNKLRFPDLRRSQDVVFNYRYFDKISSMKSFAYNGYNYRVVFGENISRIKPDHYKILRILYSDILNLHKKWNVDYGQHQMANYFFRLVYTCLISNVSVNASIEAVYTDDVVAEIVKNASPSKWHFKFVRWCILHNQYGIMKVFLKLLYKIKRVKES